MENKEMNKLLTLLKSLSRLSIRNLYHMILRSAMVDRPQIQVKETKHGYFSGFANDYLFQKAIANGSNEPHFDDLIQHILLPTDVVLDLGGNIGTHSIKMSKVVKKGHVYTFEPQSLVFSILQNNLLLNTCHNVTTYRFAVSNESHKIISMQPFSFSGKRINNGTLRVDLNESIGDFALTRTIDSFSFNKIDFIKLDIQGSELRALEGAKLLVSKCKPYMFIEVEEQHLRALNTSTKDLIELIFSLGYALYRIENNYPCDHICVPIEKIDYFEQEILPKLNFETSAKIYGSKVEVLFSNSREQNYQKLIIT